MSFSIEPKDCLQISLLPDSSLTAMQNAQMQSKIWPRIRKLVEEQQFRCVEFCHSNTASPTLGRSPLRTFMTRGVTMPELRMSALASISSANNNDLSPPPSAASLPADVLTEKTDENVRKSPIRAVTTDQSDRVNESTNAIVVKYSVPFEVAQPFANQIYALATELQLNCTVHYGSKQLQATEISSSNSNVSRRNSDSASRWNQFAVKNWHEECTSNPNSPRYSPREPPKGKYSKQ